MSGRNKGGPYIPPHRRKEGGGSTRNNGGRYSRDPNLVPSSSSSSRDNSNRDGRIRGGGRYKGPRSHSSSSSRERHREKSSGSGSRPEVRTGGSSSSTYDITRARDYSHHSKGHPTPVDRNRFGSSGATRADRVNNIGNDRNNSTEPLAASPTWRRPVFGFRRIEGLLKKNDMNQVVESIYKDKEEWVIFLDSDKVITDQHAVVQHMVIRLLSKMCTDMVSVVQDQNAVLLITLTAKKFWDRIKDKVKKVVYAHDDIPNSMDKDIVDTSIPTFLSNIHTICNFLLDRAKQSAKDYLRDVADEGWNSTIKLHKLKKIGEGTELQFEQLMRKFDTVERTARIESYVSHKRGQFSKGDQEMFDQMDIGDEFRHLSIVPTMEELTGFSWSSNLRPNKEKGKFLSGDHYLDIQFRLLREDFLQPLRKAVGEFLEHEAEYTSGRKKPAMDKVRLYTPIHIRGREVRRRMCHYWLELPKRLCERTKWDKSKRLLNGSLLMLSRDGFKSAYFGVVGVRNPEFLRKDYLISFIPDGEPPPCDTQEDFVMIESEVYFEPYKHVLKTLQKIDLDSFLMSKYIVSATPDVGIPRYFFYDDGKEECRKLQIPLPTEGHLEDGSNSDTYISVDDSLENEDYNVRPDDDEDNWPGAARLGLDSNQYAAFKAALSKEFSIIQGPPGTGKSYLGLRIAEVFLRNSRLWGHNDAGPLVVVCYTNHALDQFLEGIDGMGLMGRLQIVRLGGDAHRKN